MAGESPAMLEDFHYRRMSGQPIKMIAAAGPYTLNDNLLFEPFAALMEHVDKERPDVLLLVSDPTILLGDQHCKTISPLTSTIMSTLRGV